MTSTRLAPRDYVSEPERFGRHCSVTWHLPEGGAQLEQALAQAQHAAALTIHLNGDSTAARRVSDRFGFSVKTWSDYSLGKSWMTRRGFAAATTLLLEKLSTLDDS